MSDGKKSKEPLGNPDVSVNVTPKDGINPEHRKAADKVKDALKENVKKGIADNKPGGAEKQFEAVGAETKKAGRGTSPEKIGRIRVRVAGTDQDGDAAERVWSVTPKEGKPTP